MSNEATKSERMLRAWRRAAPVALGLLTCACSNDGDEKPFACKDYAPECCMVRGGEPCRDLPEEECRARPYCFPVVGAKLQGDPFPACYEPESFIACASLCGRYNNPEPTCTFRPDHPETCYCLPFMTMIPDGWVDVTDCDDIPPGGCGE